MLRIELLFNSKIFGIPSAHEYELHTKIVTFLIEKMKLVSFSLFLDAFFPPPPLDPRCPLDNDMPLYTYTTYVKGVLGLGGERGCILPEGVFALHLFSR